MKRLLPLIASAVLIVGFTSGCGGDGGGRPTVDELSSGIQDNMGDELGGDVTDDMADCIAKAFHDSDLSDDALQSIVDGDDDYDASDDDKEALSSVTEDMTACATAGVEDPTDTE